MSRLFCLLVRIEKFSHSLIYSSGELMLRLLRIVFVVCCSVLLVGPGFAAKAVKTLPAPKSKSKVMSFEVMRASKSECEPNCPQWIYAEGEIVAETVGKFNQALRIAGGSPLLVIQSGGGDVRAALSMGRILRARKMNVAVGYAFSLTCPSDDKFCNETLKSRKISRGFLSTQPSYCASACTLILAAGVQRIAIASSVIGTHQIINKPMFERVFYREKYLIIHGRKKVMSRTITKRETIIGKATTKLAPGFEAELERYVKSMGVGNDFLDYYDKAPPSSVYKMTEAERLKTKIITSQLSPEIYSRPAICLGANQAPNCVLIKN